MDWYFANISGKTVIEVDWKCYNVPDIYDALHTPLAENVGPGGNYVLHINKLLFVKNQNFMISGQTARPRGVPQVVSRDDLGDPNYYPGEVAGLDPYTLWEMIKEIQGGGMHPSDRQRMIDVLDKWAKPGSPNRMRLKNMGIPLV